MIVDADSWHMRRCRAYYGWDYEPGNLCRHFWKTVWASISLGVVILLGLLAIAFSVLLVWLVFRNPWLLIFVGLGVTVSLVTIYVDKRNRARPPKKEKAPGFFTSWLKAKKGRYCPLIEVRGEETWKIPREYGDTEST